MKKKILRLLTGSLLGIAIISILLIYKLHSHQYFVAEFQESTCTEFGFRIFKCWCGDSYTEDIEPIGHSYQETITEPTCTEKGIKTYRCINCGNTYTEEIAELGHSYVEEISEPSCKENGKKTYTCTRCGNSYSEVIPKLIHEYEKGICVFCGEMDPSAKPETTTQKKNEGSPQPGQEKPASSANENAKAEDTSNRSNTEYQGDRDAEQTNYWGGETISITPEEFDTSGDGSTGWMNWD